MRPKPQTAGQIAETIGAHVEGDAEVMITDFASVDRAGEGDLTFAVDAARGRALRKSSASAAIVAPGVVTPEGMTALRVDDPTDAFARALAAAGEPEDLPPAGVHPTAIIDPTARIGADVAIGPHAVVGAGTVVGDGVALSANVCLGDDVEIGDGSVLFPGVVVRQRCRLGKRCRIHPNAVIGADGFGYYHRDGVHRKTPHIGDVEIGDDVEIGANSCVDRAKFGATRIGDGTKIDNLVQVAHNCQVGRGCVLAGLVCLGGSSQLGDYVSLGGHSGVRDNVKVGAGTQVAAYSAVALDVEPGKAIGGIMAVPISQHRRSLRLYGKIPEMWDLTRKLQKRLDALEEAAKNDRPSG